MSDLKILLLESNILTQRHLEKSLHSLGQCDVHVASCLDQAEHFLLQHRKFDILICSISSSHEDELALIRTANEIGHVNNLLIISEADPATRHAMEQLARLLGYQVIDSLANPVRSKELEKALLKFKNPADTKALSLTEIFSANAIKDGILKNEFIPYYQPKFNLETMEIVGVEVLMRWKHPTNGILSPAAFIDVARHFEYLDEMMWSISKKALNFISTHEEANKLKIAINVDAAQLQSPDFHKAMKKVLIDENVMANQITLELTEEGMLNAPACSLENLINLRLLGCGISIDDFGAGLSSLQRICDLPCTEIKLDMSFTKNLLSNDKSKVAIENMVSFCSGIGAQLVIEGIELAEQLSMLRKLNCNIGQGYFFSPPISEEALSKLLLQKNTRQELAI